MAILRKLPAAVAVAALTATLVGCGTSNIKDERDAAQMERDEAQAALEQTQSDLGQAQSDLEAAQAARDAAQADADAAQADADAAAQAQADADAARMAAEQAQADADAARMAAEQAQADEEAARMTAEEEQQAAEDALADAEAAAAAAAAMAASDDAEALLPVLADSTLNTGDGGAAIPGHTTPDPMLSVSTDGMLVAEATDYTQSDMVPDMIEGWRGAMLTNKDGDTAVVYSDIGNDGETSLLDRHTSNLPNSDLSPVKVRSWPVGGDEVAAANRAENPIPWSAVRRPDEMTTVGGSSSNPITMFKGSVHGISGTFSCDDAGPGLCTAPQRYSDDKVNAGTTGLPDARVDGDTAWVFVPDEDASITYLDDMDYLTFGWWLSKGEDGKPDDLTLIYEDVNGFGAAARDETSTAGTALRGSATYKGGAAGKYAMASATEDMYEGGHFTAMATLMVDFDADDTPVAGEPSDRAGIALSGMIDNFMTGDVSRPDWMVELMVDGDNADAATGMQPVNNLGSDLDETTVSLATEWSTGSAQTGTGMWDVMFWGGGNETNTDNTSHPAAAVGTFNAHIGTTDAANTGAVGRLQGAFAVNKMDE